jgi:hypothetical protein
VEAVAAEEAVGVVEEAVGAVGAAAGRRWRWGCERLPEERHGVAAGSRPVVLCEAPEAADGSCREEVPLLRGGWAS